MPRLGTFGALTAAALALAACEPTPPVSADDRGFIPGGDYALVGMDGATVPLRNMTLTIAETSVSGRGPCNGYGAKNNAELPLVALSPLQRTNVDCGKNATIENRFFQVLQAATEMEYYGGVLKVKSPQTWLIFERGVTETQGQVTALDQARAGQ
ncbi:META domain-containing protein [Paracoccus sp. S3-43]|uniref:META domain-containing protein n=1 Tax=Paracoccus sp. S3-43 TaxID=3030011 RepID=UPI0023B0E7AF|nr:META domain-containing protein [Paracoccus sp. S3-43]WEF23842.1 META domain-containing protein [Paracoccus sp. S3-43]